MEIGMDSIPGYDGSAINTTNCDAFRDSFKFYKRRKPPPDLVGVIDFDSPPAGKVRPLSVCQPKGCEISSLYPVSEWKAVELIDNPGFLVIRNPFRTSGQRYWIQQCLAEYPKPPNVTNLGTDCDNTDGHWQHCQNITNRREADKQLRKLRWVTLGYHHNWDTKVYDLGKHGQFPPELATLCAYIAEAVGFGQYQAEAAIVNYYHPDSTLAPHTDHSEPYPTAPLFSFSFGQSAIFLLGGPTKDIKPTAMFLRSGDVAIMSETSRLSYHAVPKIICNASTDTWEEDSTVTNCIHDSDKQLTNSDCGCNVCQLNADVLDFNQAWTPFKHYLSTSRININIRQMFPIANS